MRSSDWTNITLALLAIVISGGIFFYLGVDYGTTTAGPKQVAKVIVPLDSEADELRAALQSLKAEKQQLTEEVAALTTGRDSLEQESQAFRRERDHLLAVLSGGEKNLDEPDELPFQLVAAVETPLPAAEEDGFELPAIETAAGPQVPQAPQAPSETQFVRLPDDPATPQVQVIYPSGATEMPITLQPVPGTLDQDVVSQALETGLGAFKDGEYRLAYDTWLPLAEDGVRRAQFYVGGLFLDGRGIEANVVKAHYWLSLSDQAGYPLSRPLLTKIEAEMSAEERAAAQSLLANSLTAN
jgi:FtsZ-binding cell division protein ZapB